MKLEASAVILDAEDELKRPVETVRLYDLVLRATGSEERAAEVLADRLMAELKSGIKPEL